MVMDVVLEAGEVRGVVIRLRDDDDRTVAKARTETRNTGSLEQHAVFAAKVLGRVGGQGFQLGRQPALGGVQQTGDPRVIEVCAGGDEHIVAIDLAILEAHRVAALDRVPDSGADIVDDRDAGMRQDLRTQVGVAARGRRRDIDDSTDSAVDESFGVGAVEVDVIDESDVAALELFAQLGVVTFNSCHTNNTGTITD